MADLCASSACVPGDCLEAQRVPLSPCQWSRLSLRRRPLCAMNALELRGDQCVSLERPTPYAQLPFNHTQPTIASVGAC